MSTLPFGFSVMHKSGTSVVRLTGEIDFAATLQVVPKLNKLIDDCRGEMLFDLNSVTLIDSEGLKMLLRAFHGLVTKGQAARITALSKQARRIIGIAGLAEQLGCSDLPEHPTPRQSAGQSRDLKQTPRG